MRRRLIFLCAAVAWFATAVPGMVLAQSARIGVHRNDVAGGPACNESIAASAIVVLPVKLDGSAGPVKTAKFKVVPSQPLVGLAPANLEFDLTFSPCINAGATIGSVTVFNPGGALSGVVFNVVPATGETKIRLTDCDGYPMTGADSFGWTENCDNMSGFVAPYRPEPADGATGVPVNATLSYTGGAANYVQMATAPFTGDAPAVCIGAYLYNPDNLPACTLPIDPGTLEPYTTYYWKASILCVGCYHGESAESELFSFTTGGPVPTESATWGRIKALYRE